MFYFEDESIAIGRLVSWTSHIDLTWVDVKRNKSYSMSKDFVCKHSRVVPDIHVLYAHCRHLYKEFWHRHRLLQTVNEYLCNHNSSERIRNGCINANKVEFNRVLRQPLDFYFQVLILQEKT